MFYLLCLIAVAFANEAMFKEWAAAHNKQFANRAEYLYRLAVFLDNKKFVERTPNTELNVFADMTHEEFVKTHLGMQYQVPEVEKAEEQMDFTAPESLDYRPQMNPVKDQAQCGSCWSFCTAASIEGRVKKDLGKLLSLSEQQLVDCDTGDNGCNGGHPSNAMTYVKNAGGLASESSYPYKAAKGTCQSKTKVATVTGHKRVTDGNENNLKELLYQNGPLAIGMDAGRASFQMYKAGTIYSDSKCSSTSLNHCVTLVGYGKNSEGEYWIVRNSWGTSWGDQGNFLLARNKNNMCGVAKDSTYPSGVKTL